MEVDDIIKIIIPMSLLSAAMVVTVSKSASVMYTCGLSHQCRALL